MIFQEVILSFLYSLTVRYSNLDRYKKVKYKFKYRTIHETGNNEVFLRPNSFYMIVSRRLDQQLFTQFVTSSKVAVFLDVFRVRPSSPLSPPPSNILNKHCCTWSFQSESKFLSFPISFTRQSLTFFNFNS